jgi:thymidylate kinase
VPRLFVFEGPDGVGKSTLGTAAEQRLRDAGIDCDRLSFPGKEAQTLGRLVYELHHFPERFDVTSLSPTSLQLLHIAAHVDAIERHIVPLLSKGKVVLLDRYWWSTWVYGTATGVSPPQLEAMLAVEQLAWDEVQPSAVFLVQRPSAKAAPLLVDTYEQLALRESARHRVIRLNNERSLAQAVDEATRLILRSIAREDPGHGRPIPRTRLRESDTSATAAGPSKAFGPAVFTSLEPAKPTKVYDTYWRFAAERQAMFFRRLRAEGSPVTLDPILLHHKFTNAYRASDRVSQFLIREVIYKGDQTSDEVFFRAILFKLFNRIDTWRMLEREIGPVRYEDFRFDRYDAVLTRALARGYRIYSAAYIMPVARAFGPEKRKHRTHLRLLEKMMHDEAPLRLRDALSMRKAFELLRSFPMLGDFLAYQFAIDLNYSEIINFSEMDFVVPGPGARDGVHKCFRSTGGLSETEMIRLVTDRQEVEFARLGIDFESLWGRPLQLIDCQNLFCEVGKYARLAHPEVLGLSGRTRIKQVYRQTPEPISYWYPPKWGLNDAIALERSTASGPDH